MEQLKELKTKFNKVKVDIGVKKEQLAEKLGQLKEEFGIDTVAKAKARRKKITPEISKLEQEEKKLVAKAERKLSNYE